MDKSGDAMHRLAAAIHKAAFTARPIAANAKEQLVGLDQISEAMVMLTAAAAAGGSYIDSVAEQGAAISRACGAMRATH